MRLKESSWYLACNEVVLSTHINTAFSNAQDIKTQEYLFYYVMHVKKLSHILEYSTFKSPNTGIQNPLKIL